MIGVNKLPPGITYEPFQPELDVAECAQAIRSITFAACVKGVPKEYKRAMLCSAALMAKALANYVGRHNFTSEPEVEKQ